MKKTEVIALRDSLSERGLQTTDVDVELRALCVEMIAAERRTVTLGDEGTTGTRTMAATAFTVFVTLAAVSGLFGLLQALDDKLGAALVLGALSVAFGAVSIAAAVVYRRGRIEHGVTDLLNNAGAGFRPGKSDK